MESNNIEIINPSNESEWLLLRTKDITSTEVSALFGISPYCTKFELWHRKKDNLHAAFEENERMTWGKRLESAIAEGIAQDQNWVVKPMKSYARQPKLRIGSSFDYSIEGLGNENLGTITETVSGEPMRGILEIKNVDSLQFKNGWLEDENGKIEAPLHIEIQVQHQMLVSGRKYSYIAALVGGNNLQLLRREADESVQFRILEECKNFWDSIDQSIEPVPDFASDADTISKLYGYASPGSILDASGDSRIQDLCSQYKTCAAQAKEYEDAKKSIKAELLMIIGDHEKVKGDGFSISAGVIGPTTIESYERKSYRDFRVFLKKEKN